MSNDLARVPKVTSLARPTPHTLISARFAMQRNADLRAAMLKYKGDTDPDAPSKLAGELQPLLAEALGETSEAVSETARYLADEYMQIGDAVLIVSRDTGLPLARITDEDVWQPGLVPRDSGNMATPMARLNPELSGFLIRWTFERAREEKLVEELATRVATTPFLAQHGDPRLYATTREGRSVIVEDLRGALPDLLPSGVRGNLGQLLHLFQFGEPAAPKPSKVYPGFKAYARVSVPLMDHKSRNLLFDILGSHRSVIAAQWGREIARTISRLAHTELKVKEESYPSFTSVSGLWIAPPEVAAAVRSKFAEYFVIPIEGALTTCIAGLYAAFEPLGNIVLGKTDIVQREVHDRWEIAATLDYDLHIGWGGIAAIHFTDLPSVETHAQIVGA